MRASVPGATGWQNVADGGKSAAERAEARAGPLGTRGHRERAKYRQGTWEGAGSSHGGGGVRGGCGW